MALYFDEEIRFSDYWPITTLEPKKFMDVGFETEVMNGLLKMKEDVCVTAKIWTDRSQSKKCYPLGGVLLEYWANDALTSVGIKIEEMWVKACRSGNPFTGCVESWQCDFIKDVNGVTQEKRISGVSNYEEGAQSCINVGLVDFEVGDNEGANKIAGWRYVLGINSGKLRHKVKKPEKNEMDIHAGRMAYTLLMECTKNVAEDGKNVWNSFDFDKLKQEWCFKRGSVYDEALYSFSWFFVRHVGRMAMTVGIPLTREYVTLLGRKFNPNFVPSTIKKNNILLGCANKLSKLKFVSKSTGKIPL